MGTQVNGHVSILKTTAAKVMERNAIRNHRADLRDFMWRACVPGVWQELIFQLPGIVQVNYRPCCRTANTAPAA
jgi:hypothetical protein